MANAWSLATAPSETVLERVPNTGTIPVARDIRTGVHLAYDCKLRQMVEISGSTLGWVRLAAKDLARVATSITPHKRHHTGQIDWCILFGGIVYVRIRMGKNRHVWVEHAHCRCEV